MDIFTWKSIYFPCIYVSLSLHCDKKVFFFIAKNAVTNKTKICSHKKNRDTLKKKPM